MSRRAFVEAGAAEAAALLARQGWDVVDPATAPLEALGERPDLLVGQIRPDCAEADLRRLAAIHAMAPDLPMVVVADALDDAAGHHLYDALIEVPVVRRGCEGACLAAAVAAA
jgi:hypothetical protein